MCHHRNVRQNTAHQGCRPKPRFLLTYMWHRRVAAGIAAAVGRPMAWVTTAASTLPSAASATSVSLTSTTRHLFQQCSSTLSSSSDGLSLSELAAARAQVVKRRQPWYTSSNNNNDDDQEDRSDADNVDAVGEASRSASLTSSSSRSRATTTNASLMSKLKNRMAKRAHQMSTQQRFGVQEMLDLLETHKVYDLTLYDVAHVTNQADYLIFVTAASSRQLAYMAASIARTARRRGGRRCVSNVLGDSSGLGVRRASRSRSSRDKAEQQRNVPSAPLAYSFEGSAHGRLPSHDVHAFYGSDPAVVDEEGVVSVDGVVVRLFTAASRRKHAFEHEWASYRVSEDDYDDLVDKWSLSKPVTVEYNPNGDFYNAETADLSEDELHQLQDEQEITYFQEQVAAAARERRQQLQQIRDDQAAEPESSPTMLGLDTR